MANEKLIDLARLERFWQKIKVRSCYVAECSTVSSTVIKQIYVPQFTLTKGAKLIVNFTVANVAEHPTLKVNDDNEAVLIVGPDGELTKDQALLLKGFCEFIYDGEHFALVSTEEKVRNQVVYGDEPEQPFAGMIWLKPNGNIITDEEVMDEETFEEQLAEKDAIISDLEAQIAALQQELAGEGGT